MLDLILPETRPVRARFGRWLRRRRALVRLVRRKDRVPATEGTRRLIGKLEAGGKWVASASGVAVGLGVALMITAYGALLPDFDDCVARHAASQSIGRGRQLARWFTICGCFGLGAAALPQLLAIWNLLLLRLRLDQSTPVGDDDLYWMSEGSAVMLAYLQAFLLLLLAAPLFAFGLVLVMDIAAQQTPVYLMTFHRDLLVACGDILIP